MKRNVLQKILAIALSTAIVGTTIPAIPAKAETSNGEQAEVLAEGEEITVDFEQTYAEVGVPLKAVVENAPKGATYTYEWRVNGERIAGMTNDTFTPKEEYLEKTIEVTAIDNANTNTTYKKSMYFSKLPVIYIDTENQAAIVDKENYVPGTLNIQGNSKLNVDNTTLYNSTIGIRGRGNSSWELPKKPYKLKLDTSTDLMGMGKSKHWVLLANYYDATFLRNQMAFDLSEKVQMPSMKSENVVMILNGEYVGCYQLCEQIRVAGTRVDITDWEGEAESAAKKIAKAAGFTSAQKDALITQMTEDLAWVTSDQVTFGEVTYTVSEYYTVPDISGGYLLELDDSYDEISKFKTTDNQPIMFQSPEYAATNSDMMNYVSGYVQAFENAAKNEAGYTMYNGKSVHYSELFDMDSLASYFIINELFYNPDAMKRSTYMYKDVDGLMKMGPVWDMEKSAGGQNSSASNKWQTTTFSDVSNGGGQYKQWYKSLIKDPYFALKAYHTYQKMQDEMKQYILANGFIETAQNYMSEAGVANNVKWLWRQNYAWEMNQLKTWMSNRIAWLDTQFTSVDILVKSLGAYKSGQVGDEILAIKSVHNTETGVLVTVESNSERSNTVTYYLNGMKGETVTRDEQNRVTFEIPFSAMQEDKSAENMLTVKSTSAFGTYTTYQVITGENDVVVDPPVNPVDKTELNQKINEVKDTNQAEYTDETWRVFANALAEAIGVRDKEDVKQEEVNEALKNLTEAFDKLEKKQSPADKTELNQKINEVKDTNQAEYTDETWRVFANALAEAIGVCDKEDVKQEEVNEALQNLTDAFDKLEKKQSPVIKPGWKLDSKGEYYVREDGTSPENQWEKIDGAYYYFEGKYKKTGWKKDGDKWYLLNKKGVMLTGWQKDGGKWYLLNKKGVMLTGWQKDGGAWYLLNKNGMMATGWQKISGSWYYMAINGKMATGWQKIGGRWYYLASNGKMITGWRKIGNKWYYFNASGIMKTGWIKLSGKWYYLYENGMMAANRWIGNSYVNGSGVWVKSR